MKLNRGDIVIANLESVSKGSIQKYTRPYIIISSFANNGLSMEQAFENLLLNV